jgi:hypothetical protein
MWDGNWELFADITDWGYLILVVALAAWFFWRRLR